MRESHTAGHEEEDEEEEYLDDESDWYDDEDDYYRETRHIAEMFKRAWAAWCAAESALREEPASYGPQSFGLIALGRMLELMRAAREWV